VLASIVAAKIDQPGSGKRSDRAQKLPEHVEGRQAHACTYVVKSPPKRRPAGELGSSIAQGGWPNVEVDRHVGAQKYPTLREYGADKMITPKDLGDESVPAGREFPPRNQLFKRERSQMC
jgi:hypothetical protein